MAEKLVGRAAWRSQIDSSPFLFRYARMGRHRFHDMNVVEIAAELGGQGNVVVLPMRDAAKLRDALTELLEGTDY